MPSKYEWNFLGDALKAGAGGLMAYSRMRADDARTENLMRFRKEDRAYQRERDAVTDNRSSELLELKREEVAANKQRSVSKLGGLMYDKNNLAENDVEGRGVFDNAIKEHGGGGTGKNPILTEYKNLAEVIGDKKADAYFEKKYGASAKRILKTIKGGDFEPDKLVAVNDDNTYTEVTPENAEGGGVPDDVLLDAEAYADSRIKELAGYFSSDQSDFSQYGGSRAKARETFVQEYIQGRNGSANDQPAGNSAAMAKSASTKLKDYLQENPGDAAKEIKEFERRFGHKPEWADKISTTAKAKKVPAKPKEQSNPVDLKIQNRIAEIESSLAQYQTSRGMRGAPPELLEELQNLKKALVPDRISRGRSPSRSFRAEFLAANPEYSEDFQLAGK